MEVKINTINGLIVLQNVIDIDNYFIKDFTQFVIEEKNGDFEIRQEIIRTSDILTFTIFSEDY